MNLSLLISLISTLAIFLSSTVYSDSTVCQQHNCIAIVDGGSTGSRLHVYVYDKDEHKTPVNIKELWSKKLKPGVSIIEINQAAIDSYFTKLFLGAPTDPMPVYFYATAGMRLLPQPKQKQIYALINNWFSRQAQWQLQSAKTITGMEEGLYAWLMINYQLGTLNSETKSLVGVMDMGGASVQIVFPVENTEGLNNTDLIQLNLYGHEKKLFVHSFLGLGQNEVTHQYLNAASCFANDYELPNGLAANGDAYDCEKEVSLLVKDVHRVNRTVQPAIAANPVDKWFVLGGMAELVQSTPIQPKNKQFTNETLIEQAQTQICQQPWTGLSEKYPGDEYLYGYCLFPSYYYALIVEGYGISAKQMITSMTSNQGGDWSLGVVLMQTS
ncbi:MAG: multidrug DMT transporter permease [Tatlockia sp.]|nr:multidrug DMT transporter permease [Tatlockia sp.]